MRFSLYHNCIFILINTIALECSKASNLRDKAEVVKAIKTSIGSMQYGNEDFLAGLVAEACGEIDTSFCVGVHYTTYVLCTVNALPANAANFNVDSVRVAKIVVRAPTVYSRSLGPPFLHSILVIL